MGSCDYDLSMDFFKGVYGGRDFESRDDTPRATEGIVYNPIFLTLSTGMDY